MSSPSAAIEKSSIQHVENDHVTADPRKDSDRRLDAQVLPLCCWVYLLNFLDRSNIGNSRVLNEETGASLLQQTNMNLGNERMMEEGGVEVQGDEGECMIMYYYKCN